MNWSGAGSSSGVWLLGINNLHGFLFEPVAEFIVDFVDNFGAGGIKIGVTLGGFVDENERSAFTNAETVKKFAFEMALFDEPSRVDFDAIIATADRDAVAFGGFGVGFGKINVFEEGAGGSFFGGVGELFGANSGNDSAYTGRAEVGKGVVGHESFDGIVEGTGHDADVEL